MTKILPLQTAPRILAVANQKGGVGKTTTAINLATALAVLSKRTLVVDLDPQGNASTGLGIARSDRRYSTYHVLLNDISIRDAIIHSKVPNLDIIPSTVELAGVEIELINQPRRRPAGRVRRASVWCPGSPIALDRLPAESRTPSRPTPGRSKPPSARGSLEAIRRSKP